MMRTTRVLRESQLQHRTHRGCRRAGHDQRDKHQSPVLNGYVATQLVSANELSEYFNFGKPLCSTAAFLERLCAPRQIQP